MGKWEVSGEEMQPKEHDQGMVQGQHMIKILKKQHLQK